MITKLTFRQPQATRQPPRYPTWASSRRDFLRALGGAAAGGVLATLLGCDDERAVPPDPDGGHINDTFGMPDSPRAPRDTGPDIRPHYNTGDGFPVDMPAPLDQALEAAPMDLPPPDVTPPLDFPGAMPDMPAPKDLQPEGCIITPDFASGKPDAPVTPKDLWPHYSDAGAPTPPDIPWRPPKDGSGGK